MMFKFSLRDLFWLVLLSAVLTGWFTHAERHRRVRTAQRLEFDGRVNDKYRAQVELRRVELKKIREEKELVAGEVKQVQQQTEKASRERDEVRNDRRVWAEAALAGRWEVSETVVNGKAYDFVGKPAQMAFEGGYWLEREPDHPFSLSGEYKIVRPGELDIDTTGIPGFKTPTRWRYKIEGGKLWMIRSKTPGERPSDFDAVNDPDLILYLLRKMELEPGRPAQPTQSPVIGREI